jgi:PAS domain S-box-containing protein
MWNTSGFFDPLFRNARTNAMLIMSEDGIISEVNEAFTMAFGYTTEDLKSKHFRILYIQKDQITRRPEIELSLTHREGACTDENYLVHKDGTPIWVTGESVLIKTEDITCIVKVVHNIHAQKQLERYLVDSTELLDSLFESVQQNALLLLDAQMKAIKANGTFKRMFNVQTVITEGSRLQQLGNSFWCSEEIKNDIRNAIVNGSPINKDYSLQEEENKTRSLHITSKLIVSEQTFEKKLLLMIKEV